MKIVMQIIIKSSWWSPAGRANCSWADEKWERSRRQCRSWDPRNLTITMLMRVKRTMTMMMTMTMTRTKVVVMNYMNMMRMIPHWGCIRRQGASMRRGNEETWYEAHNGTAGSERIIIMWKRIIIMWKRIVIMWKSINIIMCGREFRRQSWAKISLTTNLWLFNHPHYENHHHNHHQSSSSH